MFCAILAQNFSMSAYCRTLYAGDSCKTLGVEQNIRTSPAVDSLSEADLIPAGTSTNSSFNTSSSNSSGNEMENHTGYQSSDNVNIQWNFTFDFFKSKVQELFQFKTFVHLDTDASNANRDVQADHSTTQETQFQDTLINNNLLTHHPIFHPRLPETCIPLQVSASEPKQKSKQHSHSTSDHDQTTNNDKHLKTYSSSNKTSYLTTKPAMPPTRYPPLITNDPTPNELSNLNNDEPDGSGHRMKALTDLKQPFVATPQPNFRMHVPLHVEPDQKQDERAQRSSFCSDESEGSSRQLEKFEILKVDFGATSKPPYREIKIPLHVDLDEKKPEEESISSSDDSENSCKHVNEFENFQNEFVPTRQSSLPKIEIPLHVDVDQTQYEDKSSSSSDDSDSCGRRLKKFENFTKGFAETVEPSLPKMQTLLHVDINQKQNTSSEETNSSSDESGGSGSGRQLKQYEILKKAFVETPQVSFIEMHNPLLVDINRKQTKRETESSSSSGKSDGSGQPLKAFDSLKEAFPVKSEPSLAEIEMSLPIKLDETPDERQNESSSSSDESDDSGSGLTAFGNLKETFAVIPDPSFAEIEMSLPIKLDQTPDECGDESSSSSDESDGSGSDLQTFDNLKQALAATSDPNLAEIEMSLPVKFDQTPDEHKNESSSSSDESDGSGSELTVFDNVKEALVATPNPSFAEIEMSLPVKLDQTPDERKKESRSSSNESDGSGSGLKSFDTMMEALAATPQPTFAEIEMSLPIQLDQTPDEHKYESSSSSDESDGSGSRLTAFDNVKETFVTTPDGSSAEIEMSLPVKLDQTPDEGEDESSPSSNQSDGSGSGLKAFDTAKEAFAATPESSLATIEMPLQVNIDQTPNERQSESSSSSDESDDNGKRLKAFAATPEPSLDEIEMSLPVKLDETSDKCEDESSSSSDDSDGSGSGLTAFDNLKEAFAATPDPSLAEIEMSLPVKLDQTSDKCEDESSSSSDQSDGSSRGLTAFDNLKETFVGTLDPSLAEIEMSLPVELDETPNERENESSSSSDESDGSGSGLKAFHIMKESFVATPESSFARIEMSLPVKLDQTERQGESSSSSDESDGSGKRLRAFDTMKEAFVATSDPSLAEIEMSLPVKLNQIRNELENESSSSSGKSDGSGRELQTFDNFKQAFVATPQPSLAEIEMSLPVKLDAIPDERANESSSSSDESDGSGRGLTTFDNLKEAFAATPDPSLAEIEMSLPVRLDQTSNERQDQSSSSSDESDGSGSGLITFDTVKQAFAATPDPNLAEIEMSLPVKLDQTRNDCENESSSSSDESDGSGKRLRAFDTMKAAFVATPNRSFAEIEMSLPIKLDETPDEPEDESSSSSDESDGSGSGLTAFDNWKPAFVPTPDPSLAEIEMSLPVKLDQTPNQHENESSSSSDWSDDSGSGLKAFGNLKQAFAVTPDPSLAEIEMSLPVKLDQTSGELEDESSSSSDESDGSGKRLRAFDFVKEGFTVTPNPSLAEIEMSLPVKLDQTPDEHEDESSSSSDESDGSGKRLRAFDTLKEAFVATPDPSLAEIEISLPVKLDQTPNAREDGSSSSSDEFDSNGSGLKPFDNSKQAFAATSEPSFAEIEMSLPVKPDQTPNERADESSSSSDESVGSGSGFKAFDNLKEAFAVKSEPSLAEIEMSLPIKFDQTPNERENESSSSSDESNGSGSGLTAFGNLKPGFAVTPDPSLAEIEISLPVKLDQTRNERENKSSSSSDESVGSGSRFKPFDNLKQGFAVTPDPSLVEIEMSLPIKFDQTPNARENESSSSSNESDGSGRGLTAFDNLKQAFAVTPDPSFAEIEMSLPVKLDETPDKRENESSSSSDESDGSELKTVDNLKQAFAVTPDPSFAEIEMSLPVKRDETPDEHENESSSSSDESDGSDNGLTAFDTVKEAFAVTADPSFAEIEMSLPVKLDETPNERANESSSSSDESDGSELKTVDNLKLALLERQIQVLLRLRCHCQLNLIKLSMYVKTKAAQAMMSRMAVANG